MPSQNLTWQPNWSATQLRSLSLVVGWETSGRRFVARRVPVSTEVADDLRAAGRATLERLDRGVAQQYSPDLELDQGEHAVVRRDQLDLESSVLTALESEDLPEVNRADLNRALLLYAFAAGPVNNRLVFIKRYNPRRGLKFGLFTLFTDQLSRIDDPVLSFDPDGVDMVLVAGEGLGVLSLKAFERLFRDTPELIARTPERVTELNNAVAMTSGAMRALTEVAARNGRVRARLLAALGRGHLDRVDISRLRTEMSRHGLDPRRHLVGGRLDFDATEAEEMMKLLNEDLTIGGLSDVSFTINKKSPRAPLA